MSIEFLPFRDSTIETASATELAIARLIGSVRKEFAREIDAWLAERRAAMAELEAIKTKIADAHTRFNEWLNIVSEMRIPARGEQGVQGLQGPEGEPGEPGERGMDGSDGRDGRDGLPGVAGPPGRDGDNGSNGKDGLGVSDFDVDYDGRRTVVLRWSNGERTIEKKFVFPFPIHVGTWEAGRNYEANDQVTYGGGQFMALRNTATRPETDDWVLVTKRGTPGANGKQGPQGPQGPPGRDGRDLTQLGTDGRKW